MDDDISATTIEFHRFGKESGSLREGDRYIRTSGYQQAASEVAVQHDSKQLARAMQRLRYRPDREVELERQAALLLKAEADHFLGDDAPRAGGQPGLHQLDIVTHAAELRTLPFEAVYADAAASGGLLADTEAGVVVTRRIRSGFSDEVPPWPATPSVLFVHAPVANDLPQRLIDRHREALVDALAPWGRPDKLEDKGLLKVVAVESAEALRAAHAAGRYSYVHILAHGAPVPDLDFDGSEREWGLRLGDRHSDAVCPDGIARALQGPGGLPLVVTLAACDASTVERPDLGNASVAETLHRQGIPVVVASQLPLTTEGSVILARAFYGPLLAGRDVRRALHAARVALRRDAAQADDRRHDWLSLVGYVRLPAEGYARSLRSFTLRVQLHLLEAVRQDADQLLKAARAPRDALDAVERRLSERIGQLERHAQRMAAAKDDDDGGALRAECAGLLASACKSLAELHFAQSRLFPAERDQLLARSRAALEASCRHYRQAHERDVAKHWLGIQSLALEAVLTGRIETALRHQIVLYVAQQACNGDREYWACGTAAEALLLGEVLGSGFDRAEARRLLGLLRTRSALDPRDEGFAVRSTRRQLQRYVTWWSRENGFFPGRDTDLSAQAQDLIDMLDTPS